MPEPTLSCEKCKSTFVVKPCRVTGRHICLACAFVLSISPEVIKANPDLDLHPVHFYWDYLTWSHYKDKLLTGRMWV